MSYDQSGTRVLTLFEVGLNKPVVSTRMIFNNVEDY